MKLQAIEAAEERLDQGEYEAGLVAARDALAAHKGTLADDELARLFRVVGLCARRLGHEEAAERALESSYRRDDTDRDVLAAYGQLLVSSGRPAEGAPIFERLLELHPDEITENSAATIHEIVGAQKRRSGDAEGAIPHLEAAHRVRHAEGKVRPGVQLLAALQATDQRERAAEVRREVESSLGRTIEEERSLERHLRDRSDAEESERVAWIARYAELEAADPIFLERQLESATSRGAVAERISALDGLATMATGGERRHLEERLAQLLADEIGRPAAAAGVLERGLERAPLDGTRRERVFELLARAEDWQELHNAIARSIRRLQAAAPADTDQLAGLWRKLARLCEERLGATDEALAAWRAVQDIAPSDEIRQRIAGLAAQSGDHVVAIEQLEAAARRDPTDVGCCERLGAALLRGGQTDWGVQVLRVAVAHGSSSEKVRSIVSAYERRAPARFERPITDDLRARLLRPHTSGHPLDAVFRVAQALIGDQFENDVDAIAGDGLIDPSGPLLVSRLTRDLSHDLGLDEPPRLIESGRDDGVTNVYTSPPTLAVGSSILGGAREPEVRFRLAQALWSTRPMFAMASVMQASQLKRIAAASMLPFGLALEKHDRSDAQALSDRIDDLLTVELRDLLSGVASQIRREPTLGDVDLWMRGVAEEGWRVGLVASADYAVAKEVAPKNAIVRKAYDPEEVARKLARFVISGVYSELRRALGIAYHGSKSG